MERRFRPWREKIWQFSCGPRILEVGAGAGKSIGPWPRKHRVTAIDLTPGMLDIARPRARSLDRHEDDLFLADVQHLHLPSSLFNTIIATCVFCSVDEHDKSFENCHNADREVLRAVGIVR